MSESEGKCSVCGARLEQAGRKTCSQACARERKRRYQREFQRQRRRAEKARLDRQAEQDGSRENACRLCGQPVPWPRKKYCCDECYLTANGRMGQEWHAAIRRGEHRPQERQGPRPPRRPKAQRCCLKCDRMFPSLGPDNRLCPLCRQ